jgi:hypothetical protein
MLRRAGLFGAGFAVAATAGGGGALSTPGAAAADDREPNDDHRDLMYLVGDYHVHSVYSHDAEYRMPDLARRAAQFGLDWMVFTEHSNVGHADAGDALQEHDQVLAARAENPRLLIFQGLEWYIPAAEYATVFTAPGPNEVEMLREFEKRYDGKLPELRGGTSICGEYENNHPRSPGPATGRGVRDLRRLRLDDGHRRRDVGRAAVRRPAVHHHQQLRQPPHGA